MKAFGVLAFGASLLIGILAGGPESAQADVARVVNGKDDADKIRLVGKVVDDKGTPIPNADVALYPHSISRDQMKRSLGMRPTVTGTVDTQGSFTLPLSGSYSETLVVTSPGYIAEIDRLANDHDFYQRVRKAAPGTTVTRKIVLSIAARRSGIVADEQGQPLPGVSVHAYPSNVPAGHWGGSVERFGMAETDGDGRFELNDVPEGGLTLRFSAPGYATDYLVVPADQTEIAVNLLRGASVTGTVFEFGTNKAVGHVRVQLNAVTSSTAGDPNKLRPFPQTWGQIALSGESGNFQVRNVPPGKYTVRIAQNQQDTEQEYTVWNPGKSNSISLTVPEVGNPEPVQVPVFNGYTIRGHVVEAGTTATVPGATIWMMNTHPHTQVKTDVNGYFEFANLIETGSIRLTATADGYQMVNPNDYFSNTTITLTVDMPTTGTTKDFNIPMNREQSIRGVVLDAVTSTPLEGVKILEVGNRYDERMQSQDNTPVFSGAGGEFEVSLYPGKSVRLRAEMDGYAPEVTETILMSGDKPLEIALHRGVSVDGVVIGPDDKPVAEASVAGTVIVSDASGNSNRYNEPVSRTKAGADGRFHIEGIMPGATLNMYASHEKYATSIPESYVTLPGENITSVVLKLRKATYLAGRVLDPEGKPVEQVNLMARSIGVYGYGHARTAADGSYRLDNLPEVPVDIEIRHFKHGMEMFYDVEVGREGVDFKFGTGDKNGSKRHEKERERDKKETTGITLHGKAVDYKSGIPVQDIKVVGTSRMDVTLDPDKPGEFTVDGLMISSPYQSIKIYAPGYAPYDSGSIYVFPGETKVEKTFKLGPGGSVTGRAVEQGTDKPVQGVIVGLGSDLTSAGNSSDEQVKPVVTGADGRFNLVGVGQGRKVVDFQPPPDTGFVKMSQQVDVVYNEATDLGDVEFGSGGTIKGKLLRVPGDVPIPNAMVKLRSDKTATTDADGAFEFTDLVNGLYQLQATEYGSNLWVGIDQLQTKEVRLEVGTGKLVGTILRGGQPVSCSVKLVKVGYGQSVAHNLSSDSAGRFVAEGLVPGRWSAQFAKGGGAAFSAEDTVVMPESGESLEKTFNLPSAALKVTVVDAGGTPVEDAKVMLRQEQAAGSVISGNAKTSLTNANGTTSFDGLDAGSYSLAATAKAGQRGSKNNVTISANGSAAETITLEAGAGGTLISTALNMSNGKPVPTAWCYLFNEQGQMFEHGSQRDELGVMKIENIPAGKYRVQVSAFSYSVSEKTVEISAGEAQSIDDVLYPAGALRWTLRDASGVPVVGAACTLKPADASSVESERSGVSNAEGVFIARGLMQGAYIAETKTANGTVQAMINIYAGNATDEVTLVK